MAAVDSFPLLYREVARSCGSYRDTLALVGALYTASRALCLLRNCCSLIRVHFLPRMMPSKKLSQRYGEWAVIYGASDAIALAYAEELARQGVSLVLVSREGRSAATAAVSATAATLSESYGVEAVPVVADFALGGRAAAKPVGDALRGKDVGFLVNCVDLEPLASPRGLAEASEEALWEAVSGNVAAATLMTRLVLPGMVERGRGAVVNISSGACCQPTPGRVALTASVGYLDNFSNALHYEYGRHGIFVQSLIPFQISSPGQPSSAIEGWVAPKPDVYARHAISTLGVSHRTTGYWPHTLQHGLVRCVPEWIWVLGSRVLSSQLLS